jgi:cytochrome c-type biogenesis protein CcmH
MLTFVVLAAALTVAGVVLIAIPLLKRHPTALSPAPWAALVASGVLVIGSAILYAALSNWSWRAARPADDPQTMVAHLARRLERDPQDLNGWLLLGRSYVVLEQYPLALRAFERADRLAAGRNAEALIGEAEVLALTDATELDGRAGRLAERALELDPGSGKALFFGAAAALRRNDLPLARERFTKLLSFNPPEKVRPMIEQQIAAIDQQLADSRQSGDQARAGKTTDLTASGSRKGGAGTAANAGSGAAAVRVQVTVSPGLSSSAQNAAPLFVFVRDPARPGPPLAVKRLESRFPQTVELTAADSMVPGRAIVTGQTVQVVARIARSGNPVAASGDPFGEAAYQVGRDGLVTITIDQVTP